MADNLRMELRWLVHGSERVLQYRQQYLQTQYTQYNDKTGDYWKLPAWGDWTNVPDFDPSTVVQKEPKPFVYTDDDESGLEGVEGEAE
jgi:hypothetical protein